MKGIARVTVLAENSARGVGLLAEHGLSFWIEIGQRRLLFDTGQGMVLAHNAGILDIALEQVDAIVLSHGHYDHTGGLHHVLPIAPRAKVYAHPAILQPKYARSPDGISHEIGIPPASKETLRNREDALTWTEQPTEICDHLFVTGEIPRRTDYEDTGGPFFSDRKCQQADPLSDDQAMFFDSDQGTVVLLGCAHAGVINTLHYIRALTNGRPIHAVMGGMHLVTASCDRMKRTIEALRQLGVERLAPAHCTGIAATTELWNAFPSRCIPGTVSTKLEFELR